MSRIRVVLDTNCYVSVFTKPNGFVARLRAAWERGLFVPLICEEAMAELEEVLQRPRFLLSPDEQAWAFVNIRFYAETIALSDPLAPVEGLRDPDDIIFVNLARESKRGHPLPRRLPPPDRPGFLKGKLMTTTIENPVRIPPSADVVRIAGRDYVIAPLDAFQTPPRKTIQERFKDFTEPYEPETMDWGNPQGKEIW